MTTSKLPSPVTVTDELLLLVFRELRAIRIAIESGNKQTQQRVSDLGDAQKRATAVLKQMESQAKKQK